MFNNNLLMLFWRYAFFLRHACCLWYLWGPFFWIFVGILCGSLCNLLFNIISNPITWIFLLFFLDCLLWGSLMGTSYQLFCCVNKLLSILTLQSFVYDFDYVFPVFLERIIIRSLWHRFDLWVQFKSPSSYTSIINN